MLFPTLMKALPIGEGDKRGFPSGNHSAISPMGISLGVSHRLVGCDEIAELFDGANHRTAKEVVPRRVEPGRCKTGNSAVAQAE